MGKLVAVRCEAMTKQGQPCKRYALAGSNPPRCQAHAETVKSDDAANRAKAKALFLDAFRQCFDVTKAAAVTGFSPHTLRHWRYEDPEFGRDWEDAKRQCLDDLEASLFERAVGIVTTEVTRERAWVMRGGQKVYLSEDDEPIVTRVVTKTLYDTRAAEILLRAHDPSRHRPERGQSPDGTERRPEDDAAFLGVMDNPDTLAQLDALLDADLDA